MLYVFFGITMSLTNLAAPVNCFCRLFAWPKANEVILDKDADKKDVPKTVAEMRELIRVLKEPK
jgi:hypothetical protein